LSAVLGECRRARKTCYPGAGRDPVVITKGFVPWIPACAGMTVLFGFGFWVLPLIFNPLAQPSIAVKTG